MALQALLRCICVLVAVWSIAGQQTVPYFQSFEFGPAGWTTGFAWETGDVGSSWVLGTPSKQIITGAPDGSVAWVSGGLSQGQYFANETSWVESPFFNFNGLGSDPWISVSIWHEFFNYEDGSALQYSVNGGSSWVTVGEAWYMGTNWYNDEPSALGRLQTPPAGWAPGWSYSSGGWIIARHQLVGLLGYSNVKLRFVLAADGTSHSDGFGFDAVSIYEEPVGVNPGCASRVSPLQVTGLSRLGVLFEWERNEGTIGLPYGYKLYVGTDNPPTNILNGVNTGTFTTEYVDLLQENTIHYWKVVPFGVSNIEAINCPAWSFRTEVVTSISEFPYFEDFESGTAGWKAVGKKSSWGFGTPLKNIISGAASGENSWVTGGLSSARYNRIEKSWVHSPRFDFTAFTAPPEITFQVWWTSQLNNDGARLEASTDKGTTWTIIGDVDTDLNWYNSIVATSGNWLGTSTPVWSGLGSSSSGGWRQARNHRLTGLAGQQSVEFRVAFGSDYCCTESDGFGFDDFRIYHAPGGERPVCAFPVSPLDGTANVLRYNAKLEWGNNDPNPLLPYGHKLYFGTDNPPANIINGLDVVAGNMFLLSQQLNHSTVHYWKVVPYGVNDLEATGCTVWSFTTASTMVVTAPYFENFESGAGGWVALGSDTKWTLGTPNKPGLGMKHAHSEVNAWVTSLTEVIQPKEFGWIQSPIFDFSALSVDPTISLFLMTDFLGSPGCILQFSIDGAVTWQQIGVSSPGWYYYTSSAFVYWGFPSLPSWGYSADHVQWKNYKRVLSGTAGHAAVEFRILYATNTFFLQPQGGVAVDDIAIFSVPVEEEPRCALGIFPLDNAIDVSLFTTKFEWRRDETVAGLPSGYTISIGTDNPPSNIVQIQDVGSLSKFYFTSIKESNTTYYWRVTPYGDLSEAQNCPVWQFKTVSSPIISSFPFFEDFEGSSSQQWGSLPSTTFNTMDPTSWTLGTPEKTVIKGAWSGSNAWVVGGLDQKTPLPDRSYLRSPMFNFTSLVDPYISLRAWWLSTSSFPGANLQYSVNGGVTWVLVSEINPNWYNRYCNNLGQNCWGLASGGWTFLRAPLGLGGASTVQLRFAWYGSSKQEGIAIDDIQIFDKPVGVIPQCAQLISPLNGAEINNFNVKLEWESNDPTPGLPFGYYLRVWTNSSEVVPQTDIGASKSYHLDKLAEGTIHYFQAIPYDPEFITAQNCPIQQFTTLTLPTISTFPYQEDFEQGSGSWNIQGFSPSWELGTPNKVIIKGAASGVNAFVTGGLGTSTYNANEASWVQSPHFDFSSFTEDPVIILKIWWESQTSNDGALLQVSLNNGAQWTNVGQFGSGGNWYNSDNIYAVQIKFSEAPGWAGYQGLGSDGWVSAAHSLTGVAEQPSVILRVAFAASSGTHADGFAFDEIIILPADLYQGAFGAIPQCAHPSLDESTVISPAGVTLQWITNDTNPLLPFSSRLHFGTSDPPAEVATVTDNQYQTGELLPNTLYHWKVVPLGLLNLPAQGCPTWTFTTGDFSVTTPSTESSVLDVQSSSSNSSLVPLIAGLSGALVFIILVAVGIVIAVVVFRKRRQLNDGETVPVGMTAEMNSFSADYRKIPATLDPPLLPNRSSIDMGAAWLIDFNELQIQQEIGKGAYGIVYSGRWRGQRVAVKQIRFLDQGPQDDYMEDFQKEAAVMKGLRPHTNCVLLLGVTLDPLCIVTEYVDFGSLYGYLMENPKVGLDVKLEIVKGIVSGMLHLHSEKIVHRDLAARNILLTSNLVPKISDFGMSRRSEDGNKTKSDTGPLKWMAPESINTREYSWASDVWSFGVLLFEIYEQKEPYPGLDPVQAATRVVSQGLKPVHPSVCPSVIGQLMDKCCSYKATDRPTFHKIFETLDKQGSNPPSRASQGYTSMWNGNSRNSTSGGPQLPPRTSMGFPSKSTLPPLPARTPTHSKQQLP